MDVQLKEFFQAFAIKNLQLRQAVSQGEDDLVTMFDRELQVIIADILSFTALTREELHQQFQFLCTLIRDGSDDRLSVVRKSMMMSALIDQYFLDRPTFSQVDFAELLAGRGKPAKPASYDQPLFSEVVLDSLDDRVVVLTTDYRYLYSNQANANFFKTSRLSIIGCHLADLIGDDGFHDQAKPALDRCFAGEKIDYIHHTIRSDGRFATRCRITPLRASDGRIMAAVAVLKNVDEMAELESGSFS